MPKRTDYPVPDCPNCGRDTTRVLNTYYEKENQDIIRLRECNYCEHRHYTQQPPEVVLDPDVWRVIFPKFTVRNGPKRVTVRHKSEDTEYREKKARLAARANGEPQPTRWNRISKDRLQPPQG